MPAKAAAAVPVTATAPAPAVPVLPAPAGLGPLSAPPAPMLLPPGAQLLALPPGFALPPGTQLPPNIMMMQQVMSNGAPGAVRPPQAPLMLLMPQQLPGATGVPGLQLLQLPLGAQPGAAEPAKKKYKDPTAPKKVTSAAL